MFCKIEFKKQESEPTLFHFDKVFFFLLKDLFMANYLISQEQNTSLLDLVKNK